MDAALIEDLIREVDSVKGKLLVLRAREGQKNRRRATPVKRPNGRLTEAGDRAVRAMIEAGRTDTEIARRVGLTPSAIWNRRKCYVARCRETSNSEE